MSEQFQYREGMNAQEARDAILESLADNQRELSGLRSEVERELDQHPELSADLEIFKAIQKNGYLADLMSRATPDVIQQLEHYPHTAEEAKFFIADIRKKYADFPAIQEPMLKGYLQLFPELGNDKEMFLWIAQSPALHHLMVYASPEVQTIIDKDVS